MAWTRKLPSGKYAGQYRGPDGKIRTVPGGPFTHKLAAERAAASAEETSRRPGWRAPEAGRASWREWCEAWWPTRDVEASTLKTDVGRRDRHVMPRWGEVALADITRQDIRAWAAELRAGGEGRRPLSAATAQRVVYLLSASLAAAVDAEILSTNPAARLRIGGGKGSSERYLTREEYAAIRERMVGEYGAMADLLVYTGMRWSEAAGLHTARVDRGRGMVMVAEVWSLSAGAMKAYPKGRRRREVPLPDWVELPDSAVGGSCGYDHTSGRCRSGLALPGADGKIMSQPGFRWAFDQAVAAAGLGHVRPHDLRHTYASWLLQDKVSLAEVGRLLGHASPVTTQRYAHLADVPKDHVLDALRPPAPRAANVQHSPAARDYRGLRVIEGGAG